MLLNQNFSAWFPLTCMCIRTELAIAEHYIDDLQQRWTTRETLERADRCAHPVLWRAEDSFEYNSPSVQCWQLECFVSGTAGAVYVIAVTCEPKTCSCAVKLFVNACACMPQRNVPLFFFVCCRTSSRTSPTSPRTAPLPLRHTSTASQDYQRTSTPHREVKRSVKLF